MKKKKEIFKNVRILLWDFDGVFYKPNPPLWKQVREAEYRTIMDYTGWNREKAIREFNKLYKVVTPSATQTVGKLAGITTSEAASYMERYFDRRDFVSRDEKLIDMFQSLSGYTHYILANGVKSRLLETLQVLGIPEDTFVEIVTSELSGENKPSVAGFQYILKDTQRSPDEHCMIGDREQVDLVPAQAVGMKTCLVFSDVPGKIADITLPTVYEVKGVFV